MRPTVVAAAVFLLLASGCTASGGSGRPTSARPVVVSTSLAPGRSPHERGAARKARIAARKARIAARKVRIAARKARTATPPTTTTTTDTAEVPGGALTLIAEPGQGMAPIYRYLSSPRHSLDMTMYELVDPTAESILVADASRGVTVRVILDGNEERSANTAAYNELDTHGVKVRWASTSYEATHEKAAVIDAGRSDAKALIMTLNLTSRYYPTTRDFAVIDTIPADVSAIETVFDADYAGQAVTPPAGTDLVWSPGSQPALVSLIDSAHSTLAVENEEMSNPDIVNALLAAAQRGVDVTITMTADSEWDQAFAQLTAAGVHIHLYPDTTTALYIHAKTIVADDHEAFVGSENFSDASLDYNRELGIITESPTIVSKLATIAAADYAGATTSAPQTSTSSTSPPSPVTTAGHQSCRPLSDEGGCYEPGEYCRDDDHGASGVAGNGDPITCKETDGNWEWELS
jgi:cardiolipin synthase